MEKEEKLEGVKRVQLPNNVSRIHDRGMAQMKVIEF
jgi:hypothetical protein